MQTNLRIPPWGVCITLLMLALGCGMSPNAARAASTGEVIFRVAGSKVTKLDLDHFQRTHRLGSVRRLRVPGAVIVAHTSDISATLASLKADSDVEWATIHRRVELAETLPNDPLFANQWHLRNTGQSGGTPGADIRATAAWDVTTGSASIILAIIDTGTELTHPDLAGRIWVNAGEIPANGLDDDGNGFVDDVNGWNFYAENNNVGPVLGHGTNVAGLAGAASNNGIGVASPNWNSPLMILSCFAPEGFATEADLAEAIVYACNNGARIINGSWGTPGYSPVLRDAIAYAREHGVFLSIAAGNFHFDTDAHPYYPACFGFDNLLGVSGSTNRDEWIFNYGRATLGLSAPASGVYFARYPSTYGTGSGTSYAAPLVAGVAGLVLAREPLLDPLQLKYRLMGTADLVPGLSERSVSGGRLNAHAALSISDLGPPEPVQDLSADSIGPSGTILRWSAPADSGGGPAAFYQLKIVPATDATTEALQQAYPVWKRPSEPGAPEWLLIPTLEPGTTYRVALRALDSAGNAAPFTYATVTTPAVTTVFDDPCDTTASAWIADRFELAGGDAHSGALSWQDSPGTQYTSGTVAMLTGGPFDVRPLVRPRLSFYVQHFFPNRFGEGDRLEVEASPDGGATWQRLRRFRASLSPLSRITLPLDEIAASTNLFIRFRVIADANQFVDDGVYLDDIRISEGANDVPYTEEVIVETVDFFGELTTAPECLFTGNWAQDLGKSSAPRLEGAAALVVAAGTSGATARFTPFLPTDGIYRVYVTHGYAANATNVTWTVSHDGGSSTFLRNQQSGDAHRWHLLGEFVMRYGRDPARGSVELNAGTASGVQVTADAVRFELVQPFLGPSSVSHWEGYE
ncbi:MAG: S8 family serine peptidase [Candidatus Sumerlaea chitinivorans]|nr:S8 family serine peptidase [Candidatus Sumerlaea chitinivorans]